MKFDELKAHVDALQKLLAVPTPGLPTWDKAVKDHCDQIARASPLAQDVLIALKDTFINNGPGPLTKKSCGHEFYCVCPTSKTIEVFERYAALERA